MRGKNPLRYYLLLTFVYCVVALRVKRREHAREPFPFEEQLGRAREFLSYWAIQRRPPPARCGAARVERTLHGLHQEHGH